MLPYLVTGPIVGFLAMVGYAWSLHSGAVLATAVLIAGAAFVVGGFLGFLFGIPRSLVGEASVSPPEETSAESLASGSPQRPKYQSNTNLEQISDWLTKILVGVGLVELGKISNRIQQLADSLKPALGDTASSASFGLSVVFLYSASGFLIIYLATRVYLPRLFTAADLLDAKNYTDKSIDRLRTQTETDAQALALAIDQLSPEGDTVLDEAQLKQAVKAASRPIRAQIFARAREQRTRANREKRPEQVAATIPIFRALIAADDKKIYHRNHAQLAYALRRTIDPDPVSAIKALDKAIAIREKSGSSGYRTYEYRRALSRIEADPKFAGRQSSDEGDKKKILADLKEAAKNPAVAERISNNSTVKKWLERNGLSEDAIGP
jgi:hypothetical protein